MNRSKTYRRKAAIATAIGAAVLGTGAGMAYAGAREEPQTPITGDALTRASAAALAEVGGGRVSETEVGDEDSRYEVEVTKADGSQVDVQLDESFKVVTTMPDSEGTGEAADSASR